MTVRWDARPTLRRPVLVCAFSGWNDAADAATDAVRWLTRLTGARPFAALDPEEYVDFQASRPSVELIDGVIRTISWPSLALSAGAVPGAGRDLVLMAGVEPNLRWRGFCDDLLEVARITGCELVVTLGALLGDTPHSRPVVCTGSATDEVLAARLGISRSRYEGPTGIVGVLQDAFHAASIPSASLWAAVPAYASQVPSPKATLALMRRACEIIGTPAPVASVMQLIDRYEEQVDSLVNDDDDLVAYVERLEHMTDEGMSIDDEVDEDQLPLQYAEPGRRDDGGGDGDGDDAGTLLAEVEQFLRDQSGG